MLDRLGIHLNGTFQSERLTLSLEQSAVRLAVVRGRRVLRGVTVPLPAGVMRNGQVVETAVFRQTITESIKKIKGPRRNAMVSLNEQGTLVRIINIPAVPPRLREETVRREARRELPLPLAELYFSWQIINPGHSSRFQVLIVGVPRNVMDSMMVSLRQAGVRPAVMDLKPLALVRAVNLADVVLADMEVDTGTVILVRDFIPHIVRSVSLPGGDGKPVTGRTDYLVAEIQRTLDFYNSTLASEHPPWSPQVCLTGELGNLAEVQARVELRWRLLEPSPLLSLPQKLPLRPYLVNVGLALKKG